MFHRLSKQERSSSRHGSGDSTFGRWVIIFAACCIVLAGVASSGSAGARAAGCPNEGLGEARASVTSVHVKPGFSYRLDQSSDHAIPADVVRHTGFLANTGSTLSIEGSLKVGNHFFDRARVSAYYSYLEYYSLEQAEWLPLAGVTESATGETMWQTPPITTGLSLSVQGQAECGVAYAAAGIVGTEIDYPATARWNFTANAELDAATTKLVLDESKVSGVRNVVRFQLAPTGSDEPQSPRGPIAKTDFSDLLEQQSGDLKHVEVTFDQGLHGTHSVAEGSDARLTRVGPGETVDVIHDFSVPTVDPRGFTEDDETYLDRLEEVDEQVFATDSFARFVVDGPSRRADNSVENDADIPKVTETRRAEFVRNIPLVQMLLEAPDEAAVGSTNDFGAVVSNDGSAQAITRLHHSLNAAGWVVTPESSVDAESTTKLSASFSIPWDYSTDLPLNLATQVSWRDRNGNQYGPVSEEAEITVGPVTDESCDDVDDDTLGVAAHQALSDDGTIATFTFRDAMPQNELAQRLPAGVIPVSLIEETTLGGESHSTFVGIEPTMSLGENFGALNEEAALTIEELTAEFSQAVAEANSSRIRKIHQTAFSALRLRKAYYESMAGVPVKSFAIASTEAQQSQVLATFGSELSFVEIGDAADCGAPIAQASVGSSNPPGTASEGSSDSHAVASARRTATQASHSNEPNLEAGTYSPPRVIVSARAGEKRNRIRATWWWGSRQNWKYWRQKARRKPVARGFELQIELGNGGRPFGFPRWAKNQPPIGQPSVIESNFRAKCAYADDYAYDELSQGYSLTVGAGGRPSRKCRPNPPNGSRRYYWVHTLNKGDDTDAISPAIQPVHYSQKSHELSDAWEQLAGELSWKPDNEIEYCEGRKKAVGSCMFGDHGVDIKYYSGRLNTQAGAAVSARFEK